MWSGSYLHSHTPPFNIVVKIALEKLKIELLFRGLKGLFIFLIYKVIVRQSLINFVVWLFKATFLAWNSKSIDFRQNLFISLTRNEAGRQRKIFSYVKLIIKKNLYKENNWLLLLSYPKIREISSSVYRMFFFSSRSTKSLSWQGDQIKERGSKAQITWLTKKKYRL